MRDQIALLIGMSRSEVGRHEQIDKNLVDDFKEVYKNGEIVKHTASELAAMSAADQRAVYEQTGGKATVKDIKAYKEQQAPEEDDDWEEYGDDPDAITNLHGIYKKEFIEAVNIEIPKSLGKLIIEIAYDPEDGLYHVGANYSFCNPYRGGGDSPSKNDPGYKTKEEAIKTRLISIAEKEEKIRKAIIRAGYLAEEDVQTEKKPWVEIAPCEQCRAANPCCEELHCCKTCEEPCNTRQPCRIDDPPEKRQAEIDEWNRQTQEQRQAAIENEESAQQEAEPGLLKIEAAKYTIGVLEKAIEKCNIELQYAEEQAKTTKRLAAVAKISYLGAVMIEVQKDLFEMTGDDMFKE